MSFVRCPWALGILLPPPFIIRHAVVDLNSGPLACLAITLPSEPSLQLQRPFLLKSFRAWGIQFRSGEYVQCVPASRFSLQYCKSPTKPNVRGKRELPENSNNAYSVFTYDSLMWAYVCRNQIRAIGLPPLCLESLRFFPCSSLYVMQYTRLSIIRILVRQWVQEPLKKSVHKIPQELFNQTWPCIFLLRCAHIVHIINVYFFTRWCMLQTFPRMKSRELDGAHSGNPFLWRHQTLSVI